MEGIRTFFTVGLAAASALAGMLGAAGVHPFVIALAGLASGSITALALLFALFRLW